MTNDRIPFHEWKDRMREREAAAGRVHPKEWYWAKYGIYCLAQRRAKTLNTQIPSKGD